MVKLKEVDLYSAILWASHLQCAQVWITILRANNSWLYFISVHQMLPILIVVANI